MFVMGPDPTPVRAVCGTGIAETEPLQTETTLTHDLG